MADSSALPKPGDTVAAKYLIERTIGSGGMSVVFGATHRVTGKRFAIKWLLPDEDVSSPDASTSAEAAARFIREAQVAGRFQHPNVVEVYDVGQVSGSFYMVMDWLEGESLADRLERTGPLTLPEACAYLIPCMRGMDDAHAVGIVHRDLKPANIFLCKATRHAPEIAKVLDFGIAKIESPAGESASLVTKQGVLIGTPYYLSPEQLRAHPVDHRTDIYAFGVILYQVLSGQLPFPAESFGELVLQITSGTPTPLRVSVPGLPRGVDELIARAMARDPAERFQNLTELIDALERFDAAPASLRRAKSEGQPSLREARPRMASVRSLSMETPLSTESMLPTALPAIEPQVADTSNRLRFYLASAVLVIVAVVLLVRGLAVAPKGSNAETSTAAAVDKDATGRSQPMPVEGSSTAIGSGPGSAPTSAEMTVVPSSAPATTASPSSVQVEPEVSPPSSAENAATAAATESATKPLVQPVQPLPATSAAGARRAAPRVRPPQTEVTTELPPQPAAAVPAPAPIEPVAPQEPTERNPLHMRLQ